MNFWNNLLHYFQKTDLISLLSHSEFTFLINENAVTWKTMPKDHFSCGQLKFEKPLTSHIFLLFCPDMRAKNILAMSNLSHCHSLCKYFSPTSKFEEKFDIVHWLTRKRDR